MPIYIQIASGSQVNVISVEIVISRSCCRANPSSCLLWIHFSCTLVMMRERVGHVYALYQQPSSQRLTTANVSWKSEQLQLFAFLLQHYIQLSISIQKKGPGKHISTKKPSIVYCRHYQKSSAEVWPHHRTDILSKWYLAPLLCWCWSPLAPNTLTYATPTEFVNRRSW